MGGYNKMTRARLAELREISKEWSRRKPFSARPDVFSSICLATAQAMCWGKKGISLVELGVFRGGGLSFIVDVAEHLTDNIGMKYHVYGFDSFDGLQNFVGYEDHHEIWEPGDYSAKHLHDKVLKKFENKAVLIEGDVKDTVKPFLVDKLSIDYPIGFISLDLDLYSSSRNGLKILEDENPSKYIPTVMMIVDDQDYLVTYNEWCGEGLAISEFNEAHKFRKIQPRREIYQRLRCVHILDHPLRAGEEEPSLPFRINFKHFIKFNERALKI
jgi:hypothetical protein